MKRQGADEKFLSMPKAEQVGEKAVFFGNRAFFLLSLTLHAAAIAALWFLAVPAPGAGQGAGAGEYITVSLLAGLPGDSGNADASASWPDADEASASTSATADKAVESEAVTPAPDTVQNADSRLKEPEVAPTGESVPTEAIPVRKTKPEQKVKPKAKPKAESRKPESRKFENATAEHISPKHARQAPQKQGQQDGKSPGLGHEQGGNAAGRSGQAGEKGGAGAENSAAGQGGSAGYLKGNYEYIKKRVRQYLVYSPQAKRMGIQGLVTVSFTIQQDGRVRDIAVSKSSGYALLDESALEAVRSAAPFAAPPEPARVIMPVQFSLR